MPHEFEFEINARELDAAGKSFRFPVRAAWVRGVLEDLEPQATASEGELTLRASKSGSDVIIHGTLKTELELPCARCLAPTKIHVDQQVSALYAPTSAIKGSGSPTDEYEFSADEADILPFDGETVVMDDLIRDELVLELPMTPLCSEDCPGMSPAPSVDSHADAPPGSTGSSAAGSGNNTTNGVAREIDPRLAPLSALKLRFTKQNENKKE